MIQSIRLQQFRSYEDESFEFEPGVTIIVGPNGSGKTNLLEAILMVATGSSYRATDMELLRFDAPWARVDAQVESGQRSVKLVQDGVRIQKSYVFDEKPYKLLTLAHSLPAVLFEPNHLLLLHGQPEARRAYLDGLLEQTITGFATTRRHYRRALAQRNALLKNSKRPTNEQLFVWNLRLSELGGAIAQSRHQLVQEIAKDISQLYIDLAGGSTTNIAIEYVSKLKSQDYETRLFQALEASYQQDIERGFTSYGPHRDDFLVLFDGRPAAEVASRGETRTAILALKVHELRLLEAKRDIKPIILLDDVFSELDGKRRHALAHFLRTHQTFITTTDADAAIDLSGLDQHSIALGPKT